MRSRSLAVLAMAVILAAAPATSPAAPRSGFQDILIHGFDYKMGRMWKLDFDVQSSDATGDHSKFVSHLHRVSSRSIRIHGVDDERICILIDDRFAVKEPLKTWRRSAGCVDLKMGLTTG